MADEPAPAEVQDQPTDAEVPETDQPGADQEDSFTDSFNPDELPEEAREAYQEAYKRLQSDYTKKTQTLAETRQEAEQAQQIVRALQNPETAPAVLRAFGFDLGDEEDEFEEEPDPNQRIERLEQTIQQQQQQAQLQAQVEAEETALAADIEQLEKSEGREFDAEELQLLSEVARANRDESGKPNTKLAHQLLTGVLSKRQKEWLESKKAPRRLGSGTPASKVADTSTPEGRRSVMAEAAEAAMASE